ncbi:MAG TPA: immunoglobulin domain-containing protein [Candidatus Dormibacteraeota bacterium]|nr:immunoglobulin domain-containing protein [Candidatus Dormibacteraeota bacterium]
MRLHKFQRSASPFLSPLFLLAISSSIFFASCFAGTPPEKKTSAGAPTIIAQPGNQTVAVGQAATFTVTAGGTAPLSFQWQKGTSNIPGAVSASYATPATVIGDSGATYRVVVSNASGSVTSNSATLTVTAQAPAITTQPASQTVTAGQTATFTVVATGTQPLSYQWQKGTTNIAGATSASYTTLASTSADNGSQFRVVVSNSVNPPATSNYATLTVNSAPPPSSLSVLTYHNDNSRTGLNPNETSLTTTNVSTKFGQLGTIPVTGLVDAEPLYVGDLNINGAAHNVVFVATEHDMVYEFDADNFAQLWSANMLANFSGETPSDDRGCSQVEPEIGITSTPVIDPSAGPNGTIFVVAMSKDSSGNYHQRIHALDLTTGADRMTATNITATYPGTGTGSAGGVQTFNPGSYEERAALLLLNGVVYTTWTSHCDNAPYTSWVMGYSESNLQQVSVLNLTANGATQGGKEGGIWMASDGPAADSSGNIYLLVGNGTFDTTLSGGFPNHQDYGNSFMKISTAGNSLAVADYFAMNNGSGNAETESGDDTDLGSGGEMLLPDLTDGSGTVRHLAVGAGKDSNMYIVDRDNMGKYTSNDANIYEEIDGSLPNGVWSAPAYFNNTVYYGSVGQPLMAFSITNAELATSPSSESPSSFGYPGTTPSISSNGTTNGIVWAIENGSSTGTLHAYDATNLSNELFSGSFSTDSADKFVTPLIANGKVYVGTPGAVVVFGLLP